MTHGSRRVALLAFALCLGSACSSSDNFQELSVTVHLGATPERPGGPPLPVIDWSPPKPVFSINVAECDGGCMPYGCGGSRVWNCMGGDAVGIFFISPPVDYGVTPVLSGRRWHCSGDIE